ncbi:hypothetical protein X743_12335 [Mesorhizobium sp. LNHC252B00]|nr:hypothetical protein X743_12335 [Mesorhizobium sp. LNHC252B00]
MQQWRPRGGGGFRLGGCSSGGRGSGCRVFLRLLQKGSAFLRLLARLGLLRIGAGFALDESGLVEEAQHAIGRLGAMRQPMLDAFGVDLDAFAVLGQQRVPRADRLDEPAVTRRTGVGDDDVIVRTLL